MEEDNVINVVKIILEPLLEFLDEDAYNIVPVSEDEVHEIDLILSRLNFFDS